MEFEKLKQIVAEILSVDPRELTEETNFIDDLCADSLDLYQVIQEIEETFEIEIPEEKAEKIRTVFGNRSGGTDFHEYGENGSLR